MEELFNLTYKAQIDEIKDDEDYEKIGDERYLNHEDEQARVLWAFYRPSGSHKIQVADKSPIVSIMAFNHSRLGALERFSLLHKDVISDENLRVKIRNRARMLFRSLTDGDFVELNLVLDLVPIFLDMAINQLKTGRKWNDTEIESIEATKFLNRVTNIDKELFFALTQKLKNVKELNLEELKKFIKYLIENKNSIHEMILDYFYKEIKEWCKNSNLHILQIKVVEKMNREVVKEV